MSAKLGFAALAALALASCVSVLPKASPPAPRFLIAPASYDGSQGADVDWSLIVEDPLATRVFDTTKIALIRRPGEVEYYANGEWADRAPRLFQSALIRSFENSGRILSVGDPATLPGSNFVLQTDIRAMQAVYDGDGRPTAAFAVYARLSNRAGKVLAAHLFDERVPATADDMSAIAAAFGKAVDGALRGMVDWTFEKAGAAYSPQKPAAPPAPAEPAPAPSGAR